MIDLFILSAAGFLAGVLNAVAGGGTFISLPALIYVGVPPVMANASATLAALPGYTSSAWAFRHDIRGQQGVSASLLMGLAMVGGVIGALLLTITSEALFDGMIPWLLLLATGLFAVGPWLLARRQAAGGGSGLAPVPVIAATLLVVCTYGGYFNGGLGIMILAALGLLGFDNLSAMNGLKNGLSAVLSALSVATFIVADLIAWEPALVMAVASAIGGMLGASLSRKITRPVYLRGFIVAVGVIMATVFLLT